MCGAHRLRIRRSHRALLNRANLWLLLRRLLGCLGWTNEALLRWLSGLLSGSLLRQLRCLLCWLALLLRSLCLLLWVSRSYTLR